MANVDSMREAWLDPIDEPDDTRPVCEHCGEHFTPANNDLSAYCNGVCWHLDNLGTVKAHILLWFSIGYDLSKIFYFMENFDWFDWMTDPTIDRWKRAITTRYEQDQKIIAQANELENYHDGY